MRHTTILLLAIIALCSCASHKTTVSQVSTSIDTVIIHKSDTLIITLAKETVRDSIVHDSTIITLSATGDTLKEVIYRDRFVNNNVEKSQATDKKYTFSIKKQSADSSNVVTELNPKDTKRPNILLAVLFMLFCVFALYKLVKSPTK